jgi:beta-lactamase superfamily II metal-dependent hydrolase
VPGPKANELEVSIFGPGYGESILIHIGNKSWIVVDSCVDESKQPAPLKYLKSIGVDVKTDVKLIVVTHWHDDHIRGISNVFRECETASVVFSAALTPKEFFTLAETYKSIPSLASTGIQEFSNIISMLGRKKDSFKFAAADRILYRQEATIDGGKKTIQVSSLSPSDMNIERSFHQISKMIPKDGEKKLRLPSLNPNNVAVALWVQIGDERILLGSDLECDNSDTGNWTVIVNSSLLIDSKAFVFKVAHHGSPTSYNPMVWNRVLGPNVHAMLTPFVNGPHKLPSDDDLNRIAGFTKNIFVTSRPARRKYRHPDNAVQKRLEEMASNLFVENGNFGHVKLRKEIDSNREPEVELDGAAFQFSR